MKVKRRNISNPYKSKWKIYGRGQPVETKYTPSPYNKNYKNSFSVVGFMISAKEFFPQYKFM